MGPKSAAGLLTSVDSMFTTQEERDNAQRSYVTDLPTSEISDFPDHPFKVRMDESMTEMVESVKERGVLSPVLVRPKPDGGYEMVSGHRRKMAAELAELPTVPCIVRELTDDEAVIIMVDSNLQRDQVLPSEKAFAYKMKLDAMKRQAGRPSKNNSAPLGPNLLGTRSNEELASQSPDGKTQIQRYIRLTNLIPELLDMVDNSVLKEKDKLQMALRPAVELSYLTESEQRNLLETMTVDRLFERIYEDNVSGKLTDERFMKMSQRYDEEQQQLKKDIEELQRLCDKDDDRAYCKDQFLKAVRKFMEMKTLTPIILHELVERIDVYHTQGKGKNRTQRIVIHYNFIGVLDMPEVEEYPDNVVLDSRQGVAVEYLVGKAG